MPFVADGRLFLRPVAPRAAPLVGQRVLDAGFERDLQSAGLTFDPGVAVVTDGTDFTGVGDVPMRHVWLQCLILATFDSSGH